MATTTVLTNTGRGLITSRIIGNGTEPTYLAWGTGTGTAAATETALITEDTTTGYARINGTATQATTAQNNDTYQVTGTITCQATGGLSITEAGLFDSLTGGIMMIHSTFSAVALADADSIAFTVKLQFA